MTIINYDILKQHILSCDQDQLEPKIMYLFQTLHSRTSFFLYHYLMSHFLELAHIPIIRVLFKFGLDDEYRPLSLDQHGHLSLLWHGDISLSLNNSHNKVFNLLNDERPLINQWLSDYPHALHRISKYEVGVQALKWNDYKLATTIADVASNNLNQSFFIHLLLTHKGQKI